MYNFYEMSMYVLCFLLTGVFASDLILVADGRDPLAAVALTDVRIVEVDLETVGGRAEAIVVGKLTALRYHTHERSKAKRQ